MKQPDRIEINPSVMMGKWEFPLILLSICVSYDIRDRAQPEGYWPLAAQNPANTAATPPAAAPNLGSNTSRR